MSNRQSILLALQKHGQGTYDDLEQSTGMERTPLRYAINDAKKAGLVEVEKDAVTSQPAYSISPAGHRWLEENQFPEAGKKVKQVAKESPATKMPTDKECCNAAKVVATTAGAEVSALNERIASMQEELDDRKEVIDAVNDDIRRQVQRAEAAEANRDDLKKRVELLEADLILKAGVIDDYRAKLGYVQQQNQALQEQLVSDDEAVDVNDAVKGFVIRTPSQAPQFRAKYSSAQAAALSSARRHGLAEVLALIPVGKAIRGAEWKASA